jgi:hypothetical protein
LAGVLWWVGPLYGGDEPTSDPVTTLRSQIAAQQNQLDSLQKAIAEQRELLDRLIRSKQTVAIPQGPAIGHASAVSPQVQVQSVGSAENPCEEGYEANVVSPYLRLGKVCIQPVGFMDFTSVWRDKNAGSGIGSNFGSIPYNNASNSKLSEFRFSPQNSRIGFRIDGKWKDIHVIGYNEFDFLSSATPGSSGVTNGAFVPRLRLFWVDVRRGKLELLGGQSWSLLTPGRDGISGLPADVFYSQVTDVNYLAGLTWSRQPGIRLVYHPTGAVAMAVAFENPNQYIGGSAGGSGITLPAAFGLSGLAGSQLDNTSGNVLSTPNLMPDVIAKIAFDPNSRVHVEMAGLLREFKIWDSTNSAYSTANGHGGSINANLGLTKRACIISNNFYGVGGGRYLFGQAPDLVVRANGTLQTVNSGGFNEGIELTVKNWLWYSYYGDIYIERAAVLDAGGKTQIGYGYTGSPNSQNRSIHEITVGFNEALFKDAHYGALTWMGQYEYLIRDPWYVASGAPKSAHDNAIYFDLRYTLPGSMPKF